VLKGTAAECRWSCGSGNHDDRKERVTACDPSPSSNSDVHSPGLFASRGPGFKSLSSTWKHLTHRDQAPRARSLLRKVSGDTAGWPLPPGKIANGGRDDALTVVGVMQIDQRGALPETAAAPVRLHDGVHLL
jgi:hypothetical protein